MLPHYVTAQKCIFLINMAQYCDNGPKLTEEAVEDNMLDDTWREDLIQMNNHFKTDSSVCGENMNYTPMIFYDNNGVFQQSGIK